jgi:uncharacterized membrane protein
MEKDTIGAHHANKVSALPPATGSSKINVGPTERIFSVLGGVALAVLGFKKLEKASGKAMAVTGSFLVKRGVTGYCEVNTLVDRDTAHRNTKAMEVRGVYTINKPKKEVYDFWRNLENLPRFMQHLEDVTIIDERRSSWKARIPGGVGTVSWEAILEEEGNNNFLAWSSLPGSTIDNAGEVRFKDAPGNRGTEVEAIISYRLPVGDVGSIAAKLFNPLVEKMVKEDLRRFKSLIETGEIPTIEGQPSGRSKAKIKPDVHNVQPGELINRETEKHTYEGTLLERH